MIKILCLSMMFGLFGYVGLSLGKNYTEKANFLNDIIFFIRNIKSEIAFLKTDLIKICENYECKSKLKNVLEKYLNLLKNNEEISAENLFKIFDENILTENENRILIELFSSLGKLNMEEQLNKLNAFENLFIPIYENQVKNNSKYVPLCNKMGFLMGALVCIVLI